MATQEYEGMLGYFDADRVIELLHDGASDGNRASNREEIAYIEALGDGRHQIRENLDWIERCLLPHREQLEEAGLALAPWQEASLANRLRRIKAQLRADGYTTLDGEECNQEVARFILERTAKPFPWGLLYDGAALAFVALSDLALAAWLFFG